MPTNWKYIKKLLGKEFLCKKLRGHITYDLTMYEAQPCEQQHFVVKYDNEVLLDAQMAEYKFSGRYKNRISSYGVGVMLSEMLHKKLDIDETPGYQDNIDAISYNVARKIMGHI